MIGRIFTQDILAGLDANTPGRLPSSTLLNILATVCLCTYLEKTQYGKRLSPTDTTVFRVDNTIVSIVIKPGS